MTSKILAFTIATILTASVLALTMSNQAFAFVFPPTSATVSGPGSIQVLVGKTLSGHETQQGTELWAQTTKSVLGDVCLSCWNGFAAHETQQAKELAGKLGINNIDPQNPAAELGQQGQTTTTGTGNLGSTAPSGDTGSGSILGSTANTQCPNLSPANQQSNIGSEPFRCIGG